MGRTAGMTSPAFFFLKKFGYVNYYYYICSDDKFYDMIRYINDEVRDLKVLVAMARMELVIHNSADILEFEEMYGEDEEFENRQEFDNACFDYEIKHCIQFMSSETTVYEDLAVLIDELKDFEQYELCRMLHNLRDKVADNMALGYGWENEKYPN